MSLVPGVEHYSKGEFLMKVRFLRPILATLTICASVALASFTVVAQPPSTLYDRLGGKPAITAVVDEFVARVAADKRINSFFAGVASDPARLAAFKAKLIDQICEASGGPCKYTGKDMKTAHEGMGITTADFNALVEDLVGALDKFKVAPDDKQTLLGVLGSMKKDIVEKQ
jgi:hemoglobin